MRRARRRRPDGDRDPHDQRPVRRRHDCRARPPVDPDGGRDDGRRAGVLPPRGASAVRLHRQGGPRPADRVVQPGGPARPPRGPDRRPDGGLRRGQRAQARPRGRREQRPAVRVLRPAHGLRPLPPAPPRDPQRHRDPSVLAASGRLRPVPHPAGSHRLLPAHGLAVLPAQLADALQLGNPAHPDVVLLPGRLPQGRAGLDLRPLRAGGQVVEVRRGHRDLVVPGALPRCPDPRHQRPLQRDRAMAAHPRQLGRGRQPGRAPQGRRLCLPRAVAP